MADLLGYCGLPCHTCPIHLATLLTDREERTRKRAEIVNLCNEHYGLSYSLEDITDCDGCTTKSNRLFSGCRCCQVRNCAREKNVENCAYCAEYPCEKLEAFFKKDPAARTRLDALSGKIS